MKDRGTHYARNGSVRLAYRVLGDGDTTLVWNPGWFSNVDLWMDPSLPFVAFVQALARGTRLVIWDKRAPGCPIRWRMCRLWTSGWTICTQ